MKKYLLPEGGTFFKANLHCHSTVSDGEMTPEEIKDAYKAKGYSIVAFTDHYVLIAHPELTDDSFLALNGYELEVHEENGEKWRFRKSSHICFIAADPNNLKQVCFHRSKYVAGNGIDYLDKIEYDESAPDYERVHTNECISDMMKIGRENGFFVTYNHPTWSLDTYSDYMGYDNMHAMEIYNHGSACLGYFEYNEKEYDDMLLGGKRIYCIAADDNHSEGDVGGGFVMIKADKLEYRQITDALFAGNFYASQGPQIHALWLEDGKIHIECSDAVKIRFNTASRRAKLVEADEGAFVNSADFEISEADGYVRVTVIDASGKIANTNAYFTDELLSVAE